MKVLIPQAAAELTQQPTVTNFIHFVEPNSLHRVT